MNRKLEPRKKVLIVDDDDVIRSLLKLYMTGLGNFEFWEESNGQGGLNMARSLLPDLIIADLTMPVMDGVTLTGEIRKDENPKLNKVPILVITGAGAEHKNAAYKAGANLVIEKPLTKLTMKTSLEQVLPKK